MDGSGFVVSADGHVITNAHVVTDSPDHGADAATRSRPGRDFFVHFQDGNTLPAKLVGFDLFDDIAVLKVDPTREPLTVLPFGRARGAQGRRPAGRDRLAVRRGRSSSRSRSAWCRR